MSELEVRQFSGRAAKPNAKGNKLFGQAAPFGSPTLIGGAFREQMDPKSWNKTIADGDQVLLDNHNAAKPLARRSAGTFELHAGHSGVQWNAETNDTTYAQDVAKNVLAGNYGGCSFSFQVTKGGDRWDEDTPDGIPLRTLMDIKVREVSICTFPAYDDTSVQARNQVDLAMEYRYRYWAPTMESYEEELRAADKPYGDVAYADPKNGKYPIDSKVHAKAAWDYINVARNAEKYPLNGVTLSEVKAKIKAACAKFGVETSDDGDEKNEAIPQYVHDAIDSFRGLVSEMDETTLQSWMKEVDWAINDFRIRADGEPDSSTRGLSKEETALFVQHTQEMRRAIFESRKASFQK